MFLFMLTLLLCLLLLLVVAVQCLPLYEVLVFCKAQEESAPMDLPKEREEGEAWHVLSAKTLSVQLLSWW